MIIRLSLVFSFFLVNIGDIRTAQLKPDSGLVAKKTDTSCTFAASTLYLTSQITNIQQYITKFVDAFPTMY